jgi:hypothetical protein
VTLLPTPKGSDGPNGGPGMRNGRGQVDALPGIAQLLPTPTAQAAKHGTDGADRGTGTPDDANLRTVVARLEFGQYAIAVARWEQVLGRPAPDPTHNGRLSPGFVEWMMGLPPDHVTEVGLSFAAQLKALGNGVVPQQAAHALYLLGAA